MGLWERMVDEGAAALGFLDGRAVPDSVFARNAQAVLLAALHVALDECPTEDGCMTAYAECPGGAAGVLLSLKEEG